MIDVINNFINGRKELWLEPRLKKATEEEQIQLKQEASERFSLKSWLPDAARRAGQLSITTHPSKFTHTGARTTPINAQAQYQKDGYLRSGNVELDEADATGNAAAMDVHSFLLLSVSQTQTLLSAFEESNQELEKILIDHGLNFDELRSGFLKMKLGDGVLKTDKLLKQVYFPIMDGHYHLLSLLTASSMIWEFKRRVDNMRFSEETKEARSARRSQKAHEGYSELYNLTVVGYGGTKPQVVSVLNNKNRGRSYLLSCVPPLFEKRTVRLPTRNFFTQTLYLKAEKDRFLTLHRWVKQDRNNKEVRDTITAILRGIIDQILYRAYQVRQMNGQGWSKEEHYQELPLNQRIWLDEAYEIERLADSSWRDDIAKSMARIMIEVYEGINQITLLGDPELRHVIDLIMEIIEQDKEFF